jgi:hypothetical protein
MMTGFVEKVLDLLFQKELVISTSANDSHLLKKDPTPWNRFFDYKC